MTTTTRCHKPAPTSTLTPTTSTRTRIATVIRSAAGFVVALALITLGALGTSHPAEAGEPGAARPVAAGAPVDVQAGVPGRIIPSRHTPVSARSDTRHQQSEPHHQRADDAIGTLLSPVAALALRSHR